MAETTSTWYDIRSTFSSTKMSQARVVVLCSPRVCFETKTHTCVGSPGVSNFDRVLHCGVRMVTPDEDWSVPDLRYRQAGDRNESSDCIAPLLNKNPTM